MITTIKLWIDRFDSPSSDYGKCCRDEYENQKFALQQLPRLETITQMVNPLRSTI